MLQLLTASVLVNACSPSKTTIARGPRLTKTSEGFSCPILLATVRVLLLIVCGLDYGVLLA